MNKILGISLLATAAASLCGCAATPKRLVYEQTITITDTRAAELARVNLPAVEKARGTHFLVEAELLTKCGPLFYLQFPDGEETTLGVNDQAWQALLAARALAQPNVAASQAEVRVAPAMDATGKVVGTGAGAVSPGAAGPVGVTVDAGGPHRNAAAAVAVTGAWQAQTVEQWPGQQQFLQQAEPRCAAMQRFTATHEYLWDERPLQLVARVPQHARDTQLLVKLYEVGTPRVATVAPSQPASRGGATRPVASDGSASVRVRPPMPAKRVEHPAKPEVHAVWVSGHWQWQDGSGKWVWVNGYYQQPANAPALRPAPATRPHAEARWQDGYWQWLATVGKWEWINGHWNAPPRMDDRPATPPPIAGSVWERGNWSMIDGRFVWQTGHWQRPPRRAEVVPPPPRPDARWSPGFWAVLDAAWVWNDGYYIGARPPMPAPQAEQPGVAPVAGAVWLHGYWRWEQTRYSWVAGYWERPPGQQYVWVPDPIVVPGAPAFGHWVLRVDANLTISPNIQLRVPQR